MIYKEWLWRSTMARSKQKPSREEEMAIEESSENEEEIGGYIFACGEYSLPVSFRCQTFGLPGNYFESVRKIRPGTPLFLYNGSTGCLHGIFEATGNGGLNVDPYAWPMIHEPGRSFYPAQVRVKWRHEYAPLPLSMTTSILNMLRVGEYPPRKFRIRLRAYEVHWITNFFDANAAAARQRQG